MYLSRLTGPNAVLPLIDTLVARKHPRSVFVVGDEIRTYRSGSPSEARCQRIEGAVLVGTYDAGADATRLYEDIRASLPQHATANLLTLEQVLSSNARMGSARLASNLRSAEA